MKSRPTARASLGESLGGSLLNASNNPIKNSFVERKENATTFLCRQN
jgi:hypothetical protein